MSNQKTIALEIGHWFKDNEGTDNHETHESVLTLIVGREIHRQLKRHGFLVELNGDEQDLITMAERVATEDLTNYVGVWQNHWWRVGTPVGGTNSGFYKDVSTKVATSQINLVAGIAVHFNGGTPNCTPGFEAFSQTTSIKKQSELLSWSIATQMNVIGQEMRPITVKTDSTFGFVALTNQLPVPFAYCEFGFMRKSDDWGRFNTTAKQREFGVAAAKGILKYLGVTWIPEGSEGGTVISQRPSVVTFDPNGGTLGIKGMFTENNGKLSKYPIPKKDGAEFDGWWIGPLKKVSPIMISNNMLPPYVVRASSSNHANGEWAAFDGNTTGGQYWAGVWGEKPSWLGINFTRTTKVTEARVYNQTWGQGGQNPKDYKIQGSDDGENWEDLCTVVNREMGSDAQMFRHIFNEPANYSIYRIHITENHGNPHIGIGQFELYLKD